MAYRTMPLVDPTHVDPQLRAMARRYRRDEQVRRAPWIVGATVAFVASLVAFFVVPRPCARSVIAILGVVVPLLFTLGLCALYHLQGRAHAPQPAWQVEVEPAALRLRAYGREVRLSLAAIRAVTDGDLLTLRLVDGSRLAIPEGTLGLARLRAALGDRLNPSRTRSRAAPCTPDRSTRARR